MQWTEEALIRPMEEGKPGDCRRVDGVVYLAGSGVTDGSGEWSLEVRDAVCTDIQLGVIVWVSLVATPSHHHREGDREPRPGFVTTAWAASGGRATLTARSWDCRCEPQPNVEFSYHAAIAHEFV
ncbi:MAG TPA: hypothetical protein VHG91_17985 [Longimicrobium sp.]|nr:hypothetical protein [Longimicrobium sp.]